LTYQLKFIEMEYHEFLETKKVKHQKSGFEVKDEDLNPKLFDFQKFAVKFALRLGRAALFEECGLGKTLQQMEWAKHVSIKTQQPVLILAPLAVSGQTISESIKFGYHIERLKSEVFGTGIYITNYEQLPNIDTSQFGGVVLDESSILKSKDGKTKSALIDAFSDTHYKLCCSATPSPNDHMELGTHAEFLNVMKYEEMLAMYFVHNGGETSKWRLRKHAESDFWKFVSSWALSIDKPSTLGFSDEGYELPKINYIEHYIDVDSDGMNLFGEAAVSATELARDLRKTLEERVNYANGLLNGEPCILWGILNKTTDLLAKTIQGGVNVQGKDSPEYKASKLLGFGEGEFNELITKTGIASFGMNYQHCHNMIFVEYDFKFEAFYQAVRRCYRFGQEHEVNVHLIIPKSQMNVRTTILEKERKHKEMIKMMAQYSSEKEGKKTETLKHASEIKTDDYWVMQGDSVEKIKEIPDNHIGLTIFSPPFAELYVYSDNDADMGNVRNYKEFDEHFRYLIPELKRTLANGRICGVHCMDLPIQKGKEGYIGLRDFSGQLIKMFQDHGFIYHSRVTIWKNPVTEMQRTKALGLLHKQTRKDSVMSRVGIPDYVLLFRNEGVNESPVIQQDKDVSDDNYLSVDKWQQYASPVWSDVDYSRTLQYTTARDHNDEKHICPLQLDTIQRIVQLYSNKGDVVFSPFGGIGSEGFQSLKMGRKSISIELKESYFKINKENHRKAIMERSQLTIQFRPGN